MKESIVCKAIKPKHFFDIGFFVRLFGASILGARPCDDCGKLEIKSIGIASHCKCPYCNKCINYLQEKCDYCEKAISWKKQE